MNLLKQKEDNKSNNMTIGGEIEFLILDEEYNELNAAKEILEHARNKGIMVSEECSKSMIELHTSPVHPKNFSTCIKKSMRKLNETAKEIGIKVLPFPIVLNDEFESKLTKKKQYRIKKRLLGEKGFDVCKEISGIHLHFDMAESREDRIKQLNMLNLLDPLIIAASSCSKKVFERSTIHNTRLKKYRYIAYERYPFQGDVQGIFDSYEEYEKALQANYENFIQENKRKGVDFSAHCNKYNAIWGPVRINKDLETLEIRTMDSNPDIDLVVDLAEFITTSLETVVNDDEIVESLKKKVISLSEDKSNYHLQRLSSEAIHDGFVSDRVKEYSRFLINQVDKEHLHLLDERRHSYDDYKEVEEVYHKSLT